jgi:hypothetical protein
MCWIRTVTLKLIDDVPGIRRAHLVIWNNKAIPRCKHFLWLEHHERFPSTALLHHRNIIDTLACSFCGGHEDQLHILLRCPRATAVWRAVGWAVAPHLLSVRDLWTVDDLPDASRWCNRPSSLPFSETYGRLEMVGSSVQALPPSKSWSG